MAVGKALSLALAQKGLFVTIVDFSEERGKEVASIAEKENRKFHLSLTVPSVLFVKCDVTNPSKIKTIFHIYSDFHVSGMGFLEVASPCSG
jgi:NAD(P)-dependent dehydrogenase (short-subunit alcohol dehydrogenase family)